jgi:hypothetical protein
MRLGRLPDLAALFDIVKPTPGTAAVSSGGRPGGILLFRSEDNSSLRKSGREFDPPDRIFMIGS